MKLQGFCVSYESLGYQFGVLDEKGEREGRLVWGTEEQEQETEEKSEK